MSLLTATSVVFDAVFVPGGKNVKLLAAQPEQFILINEAYSHCKAIAANKHGLVSHQFTFRKNMKNSTLIDH